MASEEIEAAYQAAIDAQKINGAIICATNRDGSFTYQKTLGDRTLLSGEKKPHQLDDVLYVASATKLLTTIAALQCVEDGLLTLTGDLSSVAPELKDKEILTGFSEDGETPLLQPSSHPITLEMLLSHSAGMTYHFVHPLIEKWRAKFTSRPDKPREEDRPRVEGLFNYPLVYEPGTNWQYSPAVDWAGRIVERATGKTLGEFMQERIFGPLDFDDAEFAPVTREDLRSRLVDLNPKDPNALGKAVLGGEGEMNERTKGDFGGHGLFITATGYTKVLHSILSNDGKLLKSATVDSMFENHLSEEASTRQFEALEGPMGMFFRVGTAPGSKAGYGLGGLVTLEDVPGWYGERTLTWGGGLTFAWFIDRKNDLCGLTAIQATVPTQVPAMEELKNVFRHDIYHKYQTWQKSMKV